MDKYKIKVVKNNGRSGLSPQYTVSYNANNDAAEAGYNILSRLIGDNDVIIEFNSSMLFKANVDTEKLVMGFLEEIRNMDLEYTLRQSTVLAKVSIFSIFTGATKNIEQYEILAYVPNSVWKEKFSKINIPLYGARYYITASSEDEKALLEKMSKMTDAEKIQYFRLVCFHAGVICHLGVETNNLNESDIKALLGI